MQSPDQNVERNRQLLLDRSLAGLKKYGVTTERNDLTLNDWLQHLLEELLDAANYIQASIANNSQTEPRLLIRPTSPQKALERCAQLEGLLVLALPHLQDNLDTSGQIKAALGQPTDAPLNPDLAKRMSPR